MASAKRVNNLRDWVIDENFNSVEDQNQFFKREPFWKVDYRSDSQLGRRTQYYCNAVSKRKQQKCPAEILILAQSKTESNILYRNGREHIHIDKVLKRKPVDDDVKEKIKTMYLENTKPRQISDKLRKDKNVEIKPTLSQVKCLLYIHIIHLMNIVNALI